MKTKTFLVASLLLVAGCASHNTEIYFNQKPAEKGLSVDTDTANLLKENQGGTYHVNNHYLFWGFIQKNDVDASSFCRGSVKKIKIERRWYQTALTFVTLGIYSPMQTTIYC